MISSASYEPVSNNRGTFYDVTLEVTEVGRKRLWRYSRENPGFQLLFTTDGVAIGAPIISGELMSKSVKMSQMPDEGLVKEAVDAISSAQGARKSQ
jgi:preprotein translocase subunit SecD